MISSFSFPAAGMVCFEKRLGCFDENEKWAETMVSANKTIFIQGGLLKHSLPWFKYLTTPKWKRFLDAEDLFYSYTKKHTCLWLPLIISLKSIQFICWWSKIIIIILKKRNASKLVDQSIQHISKLEAEGRLEKDRYSFLQYLLGRKELSIKDVFIITLSLFGDGLSTVKMLSTVIFHSKMIFSF